ncbi:MAG TPA: D-hexose-6-phosphate mutarotase [Stellaceae bacterium]|jgi:glucose-6-phosphate 1-epimerase|nr:D-hexose-6-phosphate mutarotase [Stellaceae bacterium]
MTDKATPISAAALAAEFGVAGILDFTENADGLVKILVRSGRVTGELYLQGAQVTAWAPQNRPVVFTSPDSPFEPGRPIRGGIPVIFPWFGPQGSFPEAPQHGFARATPWRLDSVAQPPDRLILRLGLTGEGNAFWPHPFRLAYEVSFGATLGLRLSVFNPSRQPIAFEEALHCYFAVSEVADVSVAGLAGRRFIDKADAMRRKRQRAGALRLRRETDRVYLDTPQRLEIADPEWRRRITIDRRGAASAIVWNPWAEKAAALGDLGADLWRRMLCVESGNVADNAVTLEAGGEHVMAVEIAVADMP